VIVGDDADLVLMACVAARTNLFVARSAVPAHVLSKRTTGNAASASNPLIAFEAGKTVRCHCQLNKHVALMIALSQCPAPAVVVAHDGTVYVRHM
jgi:hypothetical protein